MTARTILAILCFLALNACGGASSVMTENERDDAMGACFKQFENYPTQLNRCLNEARTAQITKDAETAAKATKD